MLSLHEELTKKKNYVRNDGVLMCYVSINVYKKSYQCVVFNLILECGYRYCCNGNIDDDVINVTFCAECLLYNIPGHNMQHYFDRHVYFLNSSYTLDKF